MLWHRRAGAPIRCRGRQPTGRGHPLMPNPLMLALLVPLAGLGCAALWSQGPPLRFPTALTAARDGTLGAVSTVAEVEHGLAQDPAGWSGRIVLVRASAARDVIWQPPDSLVTQLALLDPGRTPRTPALTLTWGGPDPLLAALRRVPLLGRWVPPPQRLHLGTPALYRVQLCAPAGSAPECAGAVLLDADPNVP